MADLIELGDRVAKVNVSPPPNEYSKVVINIDKDTAVVAGDDTGLTLEIDNPFGNQAMADRILDSLRGFVYYPYVVEEALLDPAAEIGDAAETITSYGGIYNRSRNFGQLMKADISAPHSEEIDNEYKFETPTERKFKRVVGDVRASILLTNNMIQSEVVNRQNAESEISTRIEQTANSISAEVSEEVSRATQAEERLRTSISVTATEILSQVESVNDSVGTLRSTVSQQANEISAKVSSTGGNNSTFGWTLTNSSHAWYSGSKKVMEVTASGLLVNGEINTKSGSIGGFTIGEDAIYNNISKFGGSQTNGVYIGTDGIQLGKNFSVNRSGDVSASNLSITGGTISIGDNFNVTSYGNVTANNMTLKGTLNFENDDGTSAGSISAANLRDGAYQSYTNHASWSNATSSVKTNGGYWSTGAGYGFNFRSAQSSSTPVNSLFANTFGVFSQLSVYNGGTLQVFGKLLKGYTELTLKTKTINGTTINYLGW